MDMLLNVGHAGLYYPFGFCLFISIDQSEHSLQTTGDNVHKNNAIHSKHKSHVTQQHITSTRPATLMASSMCISFFIISIPAKRSKAFSSTPCPYRTSPPSHALPRGPFASSGSAPSSTPTVPR